VEFIVTESNSTLPPASKQPEAQETTSTLEGKENTSGELTETETPSQAVRPSQAEGNAKAAPADSASSVQAATPTKNSQHQHSTPGSSPQSRKPSTPAPSSGTARLALFTALLSLILTSVASFYFWQTQTQQNSQIKNTADLASKQNQLFSSLQTSLDEKLSRLDERIFAQQNALPELRRQTEFNARQLSDLGARSRTDWLLAEAEYLMRLANQRLILERDVLSAEAMLSSADNIMAEIDDPGLMEIRRTLAAEINSLQQIKHLDTEGLYFKMESLITRIETLTQQSYLTEPDRLDASAVAHLPAKQPDAASEQDSNRLSALLQIIWQDLKQAITIRRLDQPLPPLLAPEQHYYLKQNLRLMLEQANLALLDENGPIFQSSLNKAAQWLSLYFQQDDPQIQQLQRALNELSQLQLGQALPDISHSLRLTKSKIESFYRDHTLNRLNTPASPSTNISEQGATR
jgi:uroporphyrin-3 C-methyltransferase